MSKLLCAITLALSLAACVDDASVGTPPQTSDGSDDQAQSDDDKVPIDPSDNTKLPQCSQFNGKADGPCAP